MQGKTVGSGEAARVLVLGASGMLGHVAFRTFATTPGLEAFGTLRSGAARRFFSPDLQDRLVEGVDVLDSDTLAGTLGRVRPDVVVNCVGLVKQLGTANDPLAALPLNSLLPHRLARLCALLGARLVTISTDCVFRGDRGLYTETDIPDAADLYGRSKLLGEVDEANAVTLRTSIIGPELGSRHGLLGWFLGQQGRVRGYSRAVFSGLSTDELSRVIAEYVLPHPALRGVWHVSAAPIDKCALLGLIAAAYGRTTTIEPDPSVVIDRSLDSTRFQAETGYVPPDWPTMVATLRARDEAA